MRHSKIGRQTTLWVKSGTARPEYLTSAFHPIADQIADIMGGPLSAISDILHRRKIVSLFPRQTTVKSVTHLPIGAGIVSVIAAGMIPSEIRRPPMQSHRI